MRINLTWLTDVVRGVVSSRRTRRRNAPSIESLESRQLLTADVMLAVASGDVASNSAASAFAAQESQSDSVALAWLGGFASGLGNGVYNMGAGVVNLGHEIVTMPIDLVGTTVSSTYEPISYYGQASQNAIQSGTPWYYISGQTAVNAGTLGTYGLASTGYQYYQTGDPTAFQQTTGAFAFTVFVAYGAQQYTSTANAPTYNLGGTGEVPGAINVQPPAAPIPPEPYLIAPSNQLPSPPGAGNVIVNSSPIAPQAGGLTGPYGPLGPPFMPSQITSIANGGYTITITQASVSPGTLTVGQTAVINLAPVGSQIVVTPLPPFSTTVTVVTPTPVTTTLLPYTPFLFQAPNSNVVPNF